MIFGTKRSSSTIMTSLFEHDWMNMSLGLAFLIVIMGATGCLWAHSSQHPAIVHTTRRATQEGGPMLRRMCSSAMALKVAAWGYVMVILLMAINVNLWWTAKKGSAEDWWKTTHSTQAGISSNTIMMAILARDQQIAWVYVPIMMMLALGFCFCMGKHVPGWTAENHSRQHNVAQSSRGTTNPNAAEVPDDDIDHGNSEAPETRNMTADNSHDILRFGKFQLPDPTSASGILKEMSAITFTDGKYRDQTFEEVWNIDRFKSYKRWLQQRLHQIDIGYSAYVVYAELKELAQR